MVSVRWSRRALADLRLQFAYYLPLSPSYAERIRAEVYAASRHLSDHPRMGRVVPEAERDDLREVLVMRYRVVYLILPSGCV